MFQDTIRVKSYHFGCKSWHVKSGINLGAVSTYGCLKKAMVTLSPPKWKSRKETSCRTSPPYLVQLRFTPACIYFCQKKLRNKNPNNKWQIARFRLRQHIVNDLSMVCLWFIYGLSVVCLWFLAMRIPFTLIWFVMVGFHAHSTTQQLYPEATISERSCSFWPPRKSPANRAATSALPSQG